MNVFKKKNFQYGTAAIVLVAIVIACVIVCNVLLSLFSSHFGWYADISASGLFRFSDESLKLLDTVDGKKNTLSIYFLTDENTLNTTNYGKYVLGLTTELTNRYDHISVTHFSNINKDLFEVAAVYGEKYLSEFERLYENGEFATGTMILRNDTYLLDENGDYELGITGERREDYRVDTFNVNDLYSEPTMAFLGDFFLTGRIMGICHNPQTAYFLSGHGEISHKDDGDFGNAELLSDLLKNAGYTTAKLDLSQNNFPTNLREGTLAVIFAPRIDLTEGEIARLSAFVKAGGHLMVFTSGVYYRLEKLTAFLSEYGISVANAKIQSGADASLGDNGFMFAADTAWDHKVLAGITDREPKMVLSSSRLLRTDVEKGAVALLTPPASYTAVGVDTEKTPYDAAVALSKGEGRGSVFVSGSDTLASSLIYSPIYANRDLLLSVLADFGADDVPLNVGVETLASDGLDLTKGQATLVSILVSVLPAAAVMTVGIIIFERRNRS